LVKRARYRNRLVHPLLVLAAVVALDAAVGERPILVGFLILGPLLASVLVDAKGTALVGALAVVLAAVLGVVNDIWGTTDLLVRVTVVAAGSAVATVIARLRVERELAAERLAAEHAVARVLAESSSRRDATGRLLEAIAEALDFDVAAMWTIKDDTMQCVDMWQRQDVQAQEFEEASRRAAFNRGVGLPGRVWEAGGPVWVDNLDEDPTLPRAALAARAGLRSGVGFLVRGSKGVVGMLELHAREEVKPDPGLLETLDGVGLRIGQYIERRMAEEAVHQSEARKAAVLASSLDGIITIDHEGRVTEFNPAAERTFGYTRDEAIGRELAELVIPPDLRQRHREGLAHYLSTGEGPLLDRRVEIRAVRADGSEFPVELTVTPIRLQGPPTFTGYVRDISDRRRAEEQRERLLELERGARAAAEEAERHATFLAEVSALLDESLDYDATLRRLAQLAVPQLADFCAVDVLDEQGNIEHVGMAHVNPAKLPLLKQVRDQFPAEVGDPEGIGRTLDTGEALLYEEVSEQVVEATARDEEHLRILREIGPRSVIVVPMRTRGRTLGSILLGASEGDRRFGEDDLRVAEELARRAAVAVDNARLYSERSYIARTLQESLLPPLLTQIPGLEVAARYHAAGEGFEVGGDFYDLFQTGESEWAVVIGDVCGKGADAAAVTALARYTLRAAAIQPGSPSAILRLLNDAMIAQQEDRRFCTALYARLTPRDGGAAAEFSTGGHPLPLVLSREGEVREVGEPGTLIGVLDEPHLSDQQVELGEGDALVLYTDGVSDVNAPDHPNAPAELRTLVAGFAGLSADEIAAGIEEASVERQGGAARDDIAILVLRVSPHGRR
jgi:PAS domain S-box-containing protein